MRIAILSPKFPPEYIGGAEISAYNIAKHLARMGHDVHVITRRQNKAKEDGFKVHFIDFTERPSFLRYRSTAKRLAMKAVEIRPDIIFSETLYSGAHAGMIAKRRLGVPLVVRPTGEAYFISNILKRVTVRRILSKADLVLPLTDHMERVIKSICPGARTYVVGEGIEIGMCSSTRKAKLPKESVLFLGRLTELKGVKYLIEAFSEVREKRPDAHLVIAGYGELEENLKEQAKKQGTEGITFKGKVERKDVPGYMKACEVFVLPSISEGFPLVILEAMSCGAPIIATGVRAMPEIVKDGKNGLLVKPRDPKGLARCILQLLGDRRLRESMSRNNIEFSKGYSWENISRKIESKIIEICSKKCNRSRI